MYVRGAWVLDTYSTVLVHANGWGGGGGGGGGGQNFLE